MPRMAWTWKGSVVVISAPWTMVSVSVGAPPAALAAASVPLLAAGACAGRGGGDGDARRRATGSTLAAARQRRGNARAGWREGRRTGEAGGSGTAGADGVP